MYLCFCGICWIHYRPQVGARLCFYRRLWFCPRGGGESTWPGAPPPGPARHTPPDQVHPPGPGAPWPGIPPQDQVHPPGPGTPPQDQVHPRTRCTPRDQVHHNPTRYTPQDQVHPPPLAQNMLGDTVNARAVRILLECNLVCCASCCGKTRIRRGLVSVCSYGNMVFFCFSPLLFMYSHIQFRCSVYMQNSNFHNIRPEGNTSQNR